MSDLEAFRDLVGATDAVCARGGGTRWEVGGTSAEGVKEVSAPSGIEWHNPAEMTVRVGAATPLVDLQEVLLEHGQETTLDGPVGCTVGGVLAVGRSSLRRVRVGALTEALLQADCVGSNGMLFTAGGPTVKNVAGYDLCRLLVGSLGTLALFGVVVLRTRPAPEHSIWLEGQVDPGVVLESCYRPASILWNGAVTHVRLEGYHVDVTAQASALTCFGFIEVAGPPALPPIRARWEGQLPAGGILEVGTGLVHQVDRVDPPPPSPTVQALAKRLKQSFDPTGRLNPGRDPYREVS